MHIVAANISLWIRMLARESLEAIVEVVHEGLKHKIKMVNLIKFEVS